MAQKRELLEKLLIKIDEWANEDGSEWFKKELGRKYSSANTFKESEIINCIQDIKRTRYFLKNIDKNYYNEACIYYKNVSDIVLKKELVQDYKYMKIAETESNLIEFARYLVLQLENSLNYVIRKVDAYSLINSDPTFFIDRKDGKIISNLSSGNYSFFLEKPFGESLRSWNRGGKLFYEKPLHNIDISNKVSFAKFYYNIRFINFSMLRDLNFLRNKGSHRGEKSADDTMRIENIQSHDFLALKSNYLLVFDSIIKELKDLI